MRLRTAVALAAMAVLTPVSLAAAPVAFPGAEGFGAQATGGRGGSVYTVTNLDDSGPGSLRDAVSKGDRTIVFAISGTIDLKSRLQIEKPNITIAGQTAPGDGITLRGHELFIKNTENIIVRFIRSRPGDESKSELDAVTIWSSKDVILDHCSMSWSTDSLNDVVKESGNVTVQWCLLAEPLVHSVHAKGAHGYATGWDGRTRGGMTAHHNLIAHSASRAPRIGYNKTGRGLIDVRNNVIYNCGPSYGGETDDFNYVANYYRPGPNSYNGLGDDKKEARKPGELFAVWADNTRMFVEGNVFEGVPAAAADNGGAITFKANANPQGANGLPPQPPGNRKDCIVAKPFETPVVATQSADEAYQFVVAHAGASVKRDAVDERVLADVKNRTGRFVDTPGDVGGYPDLKSLPAPVDSDHDGIPDAWEKAHGLNPNDASDRAKATEAGYTNLEVYLNDLAAKTFPSAR